MKFPDGIPLYGNPSYRGSCPQEYVEQASIINRIRREYPDTWGRLVLHPRNEGLKTAGQFSTVLKHKAEGMAVGAADLVIPAAPSLVVEIKRQDHTKSHWQDGQQEYLLAAIAAGAFACVALGAVGAWEAFEEWRKQV